MKSTIIGALLGLNLVLLLAVFSRSTGPSPAMAQSIRTGDYLMIPGEITGGNNGVVYIVDTATGMLSVVTYDDGQKKMNSLGAPVELGRVFDQAVGPDTKKKYR